ncbi:hypothetical protein [Arthrobacter sp. OV608]|uniref:hypothetical protein n=1 Tax=Arthrobacter sp. OV608 TaxID=1882768 RepID=UPI0014816029|nr:hypothetical protein [Arthrobacter sp. OV608]
MVRQSRDSAANAATDDGQILTMIFPRFALQPVDEGWGVDSNPSMLRSREMT